MYLMEKTQEKQWKNIERKKNAGKGRVNRREYRGKLQGPVEMSC